MDAHLCVLALRTVLFILVPLDVGGVWVFYMQDTQEWCENTWLQTLYLAAVKHPTNNIKRWREKNQELYLWRIDRKYCWNRSCTICELKDYTTLSNPYNFTRLTNAQPQNDVWIWPSTAWVQGGTAVCLPRKSHSPSHAQQLPLGFEKVQIAAEPLHTEL